MQRLSRLAIVMLPLALGATVAGAQETDRPAPGRAPPPSQRMSAPAEGPREVRPRESLMQMQRRPEVDPARAAEYPPASREQRSMSDAVRRVQRSTGGQIIGAEQVPYEGRNITRVKYMDERGRVRYMDDPGTSERRPPRRSDNGEP